MFGVSPLIVTESDVVGYMLAEVTDDFRYATTYDVAFEMEDSCSVTEVDVVLTIVIEPYVVGGAAGVSLHGVSAPHIPSVEHGESNLQVSLQVSLHGESLHG